MYYRTEDVSNAIPPLKADTGLNGNVSSVWVNGNTTATGVTYTNVSSLNYFTGATNSQRKGLVTGYGIYTDSSGYPYIRFKLIVPISAIGTAESGKRTKTLYVKIGATNSANFKIINVKSQLIAN